MGRSVAFDSVSQRRFAESDVVCDSRGRARSRRLRDSRVDVAFCRRPHSEPTVAESAGGQACAAGGGCDSARWSVGDHRRACRVSGNRRRGRRRCDDLLAHRRLAQSNVGIVPRQGRRNPAVSRDSGDVPSPRRPHRRVHCGRRRFARYRDELVERALFQARRACPCSFAVSDPGVRRFDDTRHARDVRADDCAGANDAQRGRAVHSCAAVPGWRGCGGSRLFPPRHAENRRSGSPRMGCGGRTRRARPRRQILERVDALSGRRLVRRRGNHVDHGRRDGVGRPAARFARRRSCADGNGHSIRSPHWGGGRPNGRRLSCLPPSCRARRRARQAQAHARTHRTLRGGPMVPRQRRGGRGPRNPVGPHENRGVGDCMRQRSCERRPRRFPQPAPTVARRRRNASAAGGRAEEASEDANGAWRERGVDRPRRRRRRRRGNRSRDRPRGRSRRAGDQGRGLRPRPRVLAFEH